MTDDNSLDTLLDTIPETKTEETKPEAEAQAAPEAEAKTPPEGQDEPGDKDPAAPPAAAVGKDEGPLVPRKALEDERRKRQEFERQLAELSSKFQSSQHQPQQLQTQAQPQQQRQPPDPFLDPQGFAQWQNEVFEEKLFNSRVIMSRELMSSKPDFQEAEAAFFDAAAQNPHLVQQLRQHPMPAQFAYEQGRKIKALHEIGDDPAAYREKLEAEIKAKLAAEGSGQPQEQTATPTPQASAPKSLAGTPSEQPRDTRGRFAGPASLDDLLGG